MLWGYRPPVGYLSLWVWLPKTWLLRESVWKKKISVYEVPGRQAERWGERAAFAEELWTAASP